MAQSPLPFATVAGASLSMTFDDVLGLITEVIVDATMAERAVVFILLSPTETEISRDVVQPGAKLVKLLPAISRFPQATMSKLRPSDGVLISQPDTRYRFMAL